MNSPAPDTQRQPHDPLQLLCTHMQNSIAPIGVEVNAPHLIAWAREQGFERFRHQYLTKEIKVWAQHLHKRPVNHIRFIEPFAIVDAAGLTEIVFALGHNLKLMQGRNKEQSATLAASEINRENIALLKGLGFNHIYLKVSKTDDVERITAVVQNIREFNIERVSLAIAQTPQHANPLAWVLELLLATSVQSITFALPATHIFDNSLSALTSAFMQLGYSLHNEHLLARFRSSLPAKPDDTVRLGPGSHSHIGPFKLNNFTQPEPYLSQLTKSELPLEPFDEL